MLRCLELAARGAGWVHPNPLVGCVVVRKGRVVGEGYHRRFGGPHAETLALQKAGKKTKGATLYVNLEPCAHHGKTPPCVDAIVKAGIRRVVSASEDPNPLVSGKGFRKLRSAGISVSVGTMRREAREINERFFGFMEKGIPFVGAKIAQTLDGRIADYRGMSKWITSEKARSYGHFLRSVYDAVLVGASTVRNDDPLLTVRAVNGKNPARVIVDGVFSVSTNAKVLRNSAAPTIVLTLASALRKNQAKALQLERRGVTVLGIESRRFIRPADILQVLSGLGFTSLLIEGGARTIRLFMESARIDKIHCFIAPKILGGGITGMEMSPLRLRSAVILKNPKVTLLDPDLLIEGTLK